MVCTLFEAENPPIVSQIEQASHHFSNEKVDSKNDTDESLLLHNAILEPYAPTANHICHQYVGEQSVSDNGNLAR